MAAAALDGPLKEGVSQHIPLLAVATAWDSARREYA